MCGFYEINRFYCREADEDSVFEEEGEREDACWDDEEEREELERCD